MKSEEKKWEFLHFVIVWDRIIYSIVFTETPIENFFMESYHTNTIKFIQNIIQ